MTDASIVSFRHRLAQILQGRREGVGGDVVVLAIDGIPADLAERHWTGASLTILSSVFPTTSSTAWLSSLTGAPVEDHGVPGVVYRDAAGRMMNIYHEGARPPHAGSTIFTDAAALGYEALAIAGDLEDVDCGWREALFHDARVLWDNRFYTRAGGGYAAGDPAGLLARIEAALNGAIAGEAGGRPRAPRLVWCFIETDLHVHHFGYDDHVDAVLAGVDALARRLVARGVMVVAHSDHGLTPTHQSPEVAALFDRLQEEGAQVGGAGRTRWIYPAPGRAQAMFDQTRQALDGVARVEWVGAFFDAGGKVREAVGDIVVVAEGEAFLAPPGYTHEHGSLSERELLVPFAVWSG